MNLSEYQADVKRTMNPEVNSRDIPVMCGLALPGESGEIADHLKKWKFQGHDLDTAEIVDELGDVLYYVTMLSGWLGYGLDEIMEENVAKREKRYPNGFEKERSINRSE